MTGPVVSRSWWQAHRDEVVLVDVRRDVGGQSGAAGYERGHLPGAVLVDLERVLADPPSPERGRHPLPSPERFAEGLSRAGVGDDDVVVAYDVEGGVIAARLVWMLRVTGRDAALLDGGVQADDVLEPGRARRPPAPFTARPWPPGVLADLEDALSADHVVLDARSRERFSGAPDPLDPRPGHIPGARSLPCRGNLDERGLLLPVDVLRRRFAAAGVTDPSSVVHYCGSGVTACHNLLVMEHAGLGGGRLYPGSWSQYASDPDRPAELAERPGS